MIAMWFEKGENVDSLNNPSIHQCINRRPKMQKRRRVPWSVDCDLSHFLFMCDFSHLKTYMNMVAKTNGVHWLYNLTFLYAFALNGISIENSKNFLFSGHSSRRIFYINDMLEVDMQIPADLKGHSIKICFFRHQRNLFHFT